MATNTKKQIQDDFNVTEQPQAMTAEDVNNQDSRTRLWQSLKTGYDYQKENTAQAYDQNRSAADRAALQRGMGRSSYNLQTMANIDTEKAKALTQIDQNLIADYQNRIGQLEQQEAENERWEREFAANREDAAWNKSFQQKQADISQNNWQAEFNANRADTAWSQGMQEKQFGFTQQQWEDQKAQWREEFDYNKMTSGQQIAYNYLMNMLESGDNPSDSLLKQAGISRRDYNQMKTAAKKSGRGGGGGPKNPGTQNPDDTTTPSDKNLENEATDSTKSTGQMPLNPNLSQDFNDWKTSASNLKNQLNRNSRNRINARDLVGR